MFLTHFLYVVTGSVTMIRLFFGDQDETYPDQKK